MHISSKKLALTSVAYAVTLFAVALTATSQFETLDSAKAEELNTTEYEDNIPVISSVVRTQAEVFASYRNAKDALAPGQLSELLSAVGFKGKEHKIAWGIAMRESNARPLAHNGNKRTGDSSYGIFQVNMIGDLGPDRREKFGLTSNNQLYDPVLNAQVAYLMSKGGEDFGAWGIGPNAYRSGAGMSTLKRLNEYPGIIKVITE
jgi:hypothetical protein